MYGKLLELVFLEVFRCFKTQSSSKKKYLKLYFVISFLVIYLMLVVKKYFEMSKIFFSHPCL